MNVFLDDERVAPPGWTQCRWPDEVIELLQNSQVKALSLDHDLGDDDRGTGYQVLTWLEQQVYQNGFVPPESIVVHSANASAWKKMTAAITSIRRLDAINRGTR